MGAKQITWHDMAEGDIQIFMLKKVSEETFKKERHTDSKTGKVTIKKIKVPAVGKVAGPINLVPIESPGTNMDGRYDKKNFQKAMQDMMRSLNMQLF